jgi:peptide methionine sulfoxide reductase MsrA
MEKNVNLRNVLRYFMAIHSHEFVDNYKGLVGFGFNRETDENTVIYYLQKLSDDMLMKSIIKRFENDELEEIFEFVSRLLKKHLSESEYHQLFLKENHP